ncbi:hypothetical protein [Bradyrhizobium sp. G127]|jgi:hypothetical protein|uniref:DUF6894 family protein n=1 Tax=Bradyrhizobium sp. G127 TaxID=2904800 RepID=UPI001F473095|nr:hypothetical protein [Bradyrhizobium sp. G127]MCF2522371.1 hypothetical protein [Bradyrhizobium sp. G127]
MARIASRSWTSAEILRLRELLDVGISAAAAAIALKKSIITVRAKAKVLGCPFQTRAGNDRLVSSQRSIVPTYFFDTKDGVTVRDSVGVSFRLDSEAIEHSKMLAGEIRLKGPVNEADLRICVVSESGREVHVELVSPDAADVPENSAGMIRSP